ncbi:MAG: low specificity L-threonine aldolase [Bacteroidales bacterium]|nr:low specificity L-threonine aldolase [Bacteroidales bacterium]
MLSFTCDYNEGAHPAVLERLLASNLEQEPGYGADKYTLSAKDRIRKTLNRPEADVFFLTGGTQTNATVISAILKGYEGAVAARTGHIAVHEAGAVEFTGHKVLTIPQHQGKMDATELDAFLKGFYDEPAYDHMVFPGLVYISFPTEYGTLYSKAELEALHAVCKRYNLPLYVDGARLGYGLMSPECDFTFQELAGLCDVFTIGGTKVGALCGEAVVFPHGGAPAHFFTTIKQHGALLAKGRLTGVQFDTLFTDGLYFEISRHAIDMAMRLKDLFRNKGYELFLDSPTNQQFILLDQATMDVLSPQVAFEIWEHRPDGRTVVRFATSWATTPEQLAALEAMLP